MTALRALAVAAVVVVWIYAVFLAGFYGSYRPSPGYTCHPTITFGYECEREGNR